jgi:pimeloyl-ACP methyl ester carboxylesterase
MVGLALAGLAAPGNSTAGKEAKAPNDSKADNIRQEPIVLETKTGKLDGTLDLPEGHGPFPVVILIAGSGPTDRDGNQPRLKLDSLKQLGHALARRGFAVLRYDGRGIGKSRAAWSKKEEDFRFEMLVDDAAEWVTMLRKERQFARIAIAGHSLGSLVGILAARKAKVDAFVSLAGVGRRTHEVLREQYDKNLPALYGAERGKALAKEAHKILDELVAGRTVPDPPKELADAGLRPGVQPYLISEYREDPAGELARLEIPVQIVHGTLDERIPVEDARRLARANRNAELRLIDGMNHILRRGTNPVEQWLAWNTTTAPLAPELVDRVATFLDKALRRSR